MRIPGDSGERVGKWIVGQPGWGEIVKLMARDSLRVDGVSMSNRESSGLGESIRTLKSAPRKSPAMSMC